MNRVAGHPPFWLLSFFFFFFFLGLWRLLSYMPMYLHSCVVIELVVLCLIGEWSQNFVFASNICPTSVQLLLNECWSNVETV